MVDYSYYRDTYMGNQIAESDFPRLITRAGNYIDKVTGGRGLSPLPDNVKMAMCAVAEAWQINEQGGDIASQSVGSWSKSYQQKRVKTDEQRLLYAAKLYLDSISVRWV